MRTPHGPQMLALLLGCVTAGASMNSATAQVVAPASATHREVLTEEDIQRVPGQSIEELLTRGFAGVQTSRTARGGLSIRIRGVSSFLSSNEPLVTLDDQPIDLTDAASLRAINSRDVTSIEVIKDAAGLAAYGVRGANGVIVIRTKRR